MKRKAIEGGEIKEQKVYPAISHGGDSVSEKLSTYKELYRQSLADPNSFWLCEAKKHLSWFSEPQQGAVLQGAIEDGNINWFAGGKLNVCYNCVDRHLEKKGDQTAILWESDEPGESRSISFKELSMEVSRISNLLKSKGVKKGDVVTIYMPMMPELAMVMLACTRIGALHSVVFAGFSSESLKDRILDCDSKWIFTADEGKRGGKTVKLKEICDAAVIKTPQVANVFVYKRTGAEVNFIPGRDIWMHEVLPKMRPYCPAESMDSEDPLFVLYTSGSTGKPKGILHTSAGTMLQRNSSLTHD